MESIKFLPHLVLSGLLAFNSTLANAADQDLDLEPCINGNVSANGLYETQALEDNASNKDQKQVMTIEQNRLGSGEEDVVSAFGGHRDDFSR